MKSNSLVQTVTGPLAPEALGVTLMHEHVIHQIQLHSGKPDNVFTDIDLICRELSFFARAGGRTVCDMTPIGVAPDPRALQEIARRTGLNIISGTGLYHLEVLPTEMHDWSRRQFADYVVHRAEGLDTGVRSGILGEAASHNETHKDWRKYRLTKAERTILQAFADAQRVTGLSISTHASLGRAGVAQLDVLTESGADPTRVVIGHCDAQAHDDIRQDLEYYTQLLEAKAWLEFDLFGWGELLPDSRRFDRVVALVKEGFAKRLLISTDTCRLSQLHANGGRGFDYLFASVIPGLRQAGLSGEDIRQITVSNPAAVLSVNSRKIQENP